MRARAQEKSRIIDLGERSIRAFFFEHPMATYAAALAYRGLFGLFPFVLILVVLVGALGIPDFFDRAPPIGEPWRYGALSLCCSGLWFSSGRVSS